MAQHIALFRGINVGKAKRVAMADLRAMFEALGFESVRTLLNSGNVVFEAGRGASASHAKRIAAGLIEYTGVSANVLVLSAKTLGAAVTDNLFAAKIDDPSRMLLGFIADSADRAPLHALESKSPELDMFSIGKHACYLYCAHGILESTIAEQLLGPKFRDIVTTRNWATVLKLQAITQE